jgi:hypothetical protein
LQCRNWDGSYFLAVPNRQGGRTLLGASASRISGPFVILQLMAFLAVTCWAVAPRLMIPVVRMLILIYGLGIGPQP